MVQYVKEIIIPYVDSQHGANTSQGALVIMDNFKRQIMNSINSILDANNVHVYLLPQNTTDLLQPFDIAVNKPVKDFLKQNFEHLYADEVMKQLQVDADIQSAEIQPINMSFTGIRMLSTKWLVVMSKYLAKKTQFIVSGFR